MIEFMAHDKLTSTPDVFEQEDCNQIIKHKIHSEQKYKYEHTQSERIFLTNEDAGYLKDIEVYL